jgi:hypothetical protein
VDGHTSGTVNPAPQASGQRIGAHRSGALVQDRRRVLTRWIGVWVLSATVLGCSALASPSPTVSPSRSTPPTPSATVVESQPSAAPSSPASGWAEVAINAAAFVNAQVNAVTPWGTGFAAVGLDPLQGGLAAWTSIDGRTWVRSDPPPVPTGGLGGQMNDVVAGGPGLVAVGSELGLNPLCGRIPIHAIVWTSTDGHRWTRVPDTHAFDLSTMDHVARIGAMFVAIGSTTRSCAFRKLTWTSPDGLHWTSHEVAAFKNGGPNDLVADGGRLVAVGQTGCTTTVSTCRAAVWTSVDGITWQAGTTAIPGGAMMETVAGGSHGFVAVGFDANGGGVVWTSADGITWRAALTVGVTAGMPPLGSVAATSGGYVMAAGAAIWVSTDGSSWLDVAPRLLDQSVEPGLVAAGQTATIVFGSRGFGQVVEWAGPP